MTNEKNYVPANEYGLCGNGQDSYRIFMRKRLGGKGRNFFDETWEESREDEKEAYR